MILNACKSIIKKTADSLSVPFFTTQRKIATSIKEKFTEVEIKVPWGKVAGKLWNPNATQPILALHGWQDNAASFDNLVKLLPEKISVLAIDLPGHGISSWLPEGMIYSRLMYVQVIHRIRQHFGWKKIGLIGHSLGGMFCFTYSALFPDDVKFVVALDFFKYPVQCVRTQLTNSAKDLSTLLQLEKSINPPSSFTEEQTIAKLLEGTENSLDESACRALMVRGFTKKSDGTVYANRDPRIKLLYLMASFTNEHMKKKAELIKSPYMILKANDWHYNEKKTNYFDSLKAMKKSSVDLQFYEISGKHHFHMINPESVAKLMIPFFEKYNCPSEL